MGERRRFCVRRGLAAHHRPVYFTTAAARDRAAQRLADTDRDVVVLESLGASTIGWWRSDAVVEPAGDLVVVDVENCYTDGVESCRSAWVPYPAGEDGASVEEWWDGTVFGFTGDGHGADDDETPEGCSVATVRSAPSMPALVGAKHEWYG